MTITIKQINIIEERAREVGDRDLVALCKRSMQSEDTMAELVDHAKHNADLARLLKEAPVDDVVSISELKATRAKMTPREFSPGEWYGSDDGGWTAIGPVHMACDDPNCDHSPEECTDYQAARADSHGLCAEHNAMPVLLELVEVLIAYEAAKVSAAMDREAWSRSYSREAWAKLEESDAHLRRCEAVYKAALRTVRP